MKTIDLVNSKDTVQFGQDNVVIQKYISGIKGGRVLDTTGYTAETVKAGHVIIKLASGDYAPMPLKADGTGYDTLPADAAYVGVLKGSILTKKPAAAIMTWGEVCEPALPYAITDIKAAFTAQCPHIGFVDDKA